MVKNNGREKKHNHELPSRKLQSGKLTDNDIQTGYGQSNFENIL